MLEETQSKSNPLEDDSPILTIAVPTYNRSGNLAHLLRLLSPQLQKEPRVELIISDNCSPDDTPAVVKGFIESGLRCHYIRNAENIGPDGNFLQCYDLARGKYFWLFSDDDVIFPGSLGAILNLIEGDGFDLVYLAPFGFVKEPNERGHANLAPRTREFTTAAGFIHAVGLNGDFALISSIIVNRSRVESMPHRPFTDGRNTNLLQLGWVFTALRIFKRGLFVERGLVVVCEDNPSRPFDVARVFGVNWHKVATMYLDDGSETLEAILNDQLYSWFPTNWYALRNSAKKTQTAPPHMLMGPIYGKRPLYWLCVYPLLTLPRLCAGGWLAIIRGIRHIDRALHGQRLSPTHRYSE